MMAQKLFLEKHGFPPRRDCIIDPAGVSMDT